MRPNVVYRKLTPEYCRDLVELHHRVYEREQIAHTIFTSPKIHSYLATLIAFPALQHKHVLFGGFHGEALVSYAYFRALEDSFHLNFIAVSPSIQGLGIGRDMIEIFRTLAIEYNYGKLSLWAGSDYEMACNWYRRLGFEQKQETYLYEQALSPIEDVPSEHIELWGWENAEAWHNAFGFSNFEVRMDNNCWKIDRLGNSYFRVNACIPPAITSLLNTLDPRRKLLAISNSRLSDPEAKLLKIDHWMEAEIGTP